MEIEEYCLCCGKAVDGRAYCSDECADLDARSPSSSSSAFPSPKYSSYKIGTLPDVPPLVPSVLGRKLQSHAGPDTYRYSTSSSSSSTAWSSLSEEDDDDESVFHNNPSASGDESDAFHFGSAKSGFSVSSSFAKSPLTYARRPSATNHRSVISRPRGASPVRGVSRSAPSNRYPYPGQESSADDDIEPTLTVAPARRRIPTKKIPGSGSDIHNHSPSPSVVGSAPKRSRKRDSLPAAFSLLSIGSPTAPKPLQTQPGTAQSHQQLQHGKGSPSSIGTASTTGGAAPPSSTPRLTDSLATLRGRPREPQTEAERLRSSTERRSRDPARSPRSPRLLRPASPDDAAERRGRRRSHELDPNEVVGPVPENAAPGLGNGRSGLVDRGILA
ncbi:hypothetical protein PUNSTDRAFT_53563 [Punctularia strigosozonata HHB-11173 SS5]|uniref:uncharacterized protein n=1 Tax=Punctularia strigosozonata (strain HHB-11173) TaxID=741275 RepID=UPI0004416880|nr:uncharacterized protein PUNSTDRAFT_53563 [Punctularia strigosozonata HHB-11173 SS5]EIN07186.1 hypothetical protein PUNSTDRAFT_53563 [Punctularia strigosozonata HHB-11173 SS5]